MQPTAPILRPWLPLSAGLGILALGGALVLLPDQPGRILVGLCLVAANLFSGWACLARARRRPDEASGWRLLGISMLVASVGGAVVAGLGGGPGTRWPDLVSMGLQFALAFVQPLALLRLPLASQDPVGIRARLAGGAMFGASLALLLWFLGHWLAMHDLPGANQLMLPALSLRMALLGGTTAYLLVDDPRRLRGPLLAILIGVSLGGFPGLIGLSLAGSMPMAARAAAGFTPLFSLSIALAALHPQPVRGGGPENGRQANVFDALLYLPYGLSALLMLGAIAAGARTLLLPMLGFITVSSLMVMHQFLLLREVRRIRDGLEERVAQRTRALEEAQSILLRTERMNTLGLIGAGLAHDLNNTLSVTLQTVDLLRLQAGAGNAVEPRYLDQIERASRHGAELGARLMAFARQEPEPPKAMDLGALVADQADLLRVVLPRAIALIVEPPPGPLPVMASPGQIQQALVNLVGNARDAIAGAGTVRIAAGPGTLASGQPCAEVRVGDDGCGMSPATLERIFEPLFTTKPPGRGTGLGLASVRAILEAAGGEVAVRSAPGAGSTFTLRLPLAR